MVRSATFLIPASRPTELVVAAEDVRPTDMSTIVNVTKGTLARAAKTAATACAWEEAAYGLTAAPAGRSAPRCDLSAA
jgi:hypothetical protein